MNERDIFTQARRIEDPTERAAYLNEACGTDHSCRGKVESLLEAFARAGSFLEPEVPDVAATLDAPSVAEQPGTYIGPYKLVEEIGEGGMGAVFMALQKKPVRRTVALKIIKPGMDSKQVVSRFEAERQALALMDHPNIAKVHDGGTTESGRPYFVMELVKGIPITEYCDGHRLTNKERLGLFRDVCSAVHHAHQKGIIHRDLKPSNVLVTQLDGKPLPKIIDFGIAKAITGHLMDESFVTGFSQLVGTPMYMSPEQAELTASDVDTRSDVYSLGVLLYELLTGVTPFDRERMSSMSFDEVRRVVREEEPPRPSTRLSTLDAALDTVAEKRHTDPGRLCHEVRGELDWIVMKALEKDRTRRYESASDLAKDVRRFLDDEPVEACPPSKVYRLGKFARRHRVSLAASCAVLLALIVGGSLATWQAVVATQEREKAEQQRQATERQRQIAQKNYERAREAVDKYLTTVSENQLLNSPGLQPLRKDLLELALKYYEQFIAERADDPQLQAGLAAAYHRVGMIYFHLGETTRAIEAHRTSVKILEELVAAKPAVRAFRGDLATAYRLLGIELGRSGAIKEAQEALEKSTRIGEPLVTEDPEDFRGRHYLAETYNYLAGLLVSAGRPGQATSFANKAIDIRQSLVLKDPDNTDYQRGLAHGFNVLGYIQQQTGKLDEALDAYRKSLDIMEKLVDSHPDVIEYRHNVAGACNAVANAYSDKKLWDKAVIYYQKAIEISAALVSENPELVEPCLFLANHYHNLSIVQAKMGRRDESLTSSQTGIDIVQGLAKKQTDMDEYQQWLAGAYNNHGMTLWDMQSYNAAFTSFQKAREIGETLVAKHPDSVMCKRDLANSYANLAHVSCTWPDRERQEPEQALAWAQKAVELVPDDFRRTLGIARYRNGQWKECLEALSKAAELDHDDVDMAVIGFFRAMAHWQLKEYELARDSYSKGVGCMKEHQDEPDLHRFRAEAAALLGIEVREPTEHDPEKQETPTTDRKEPTKDSNGE